MNRTRRVWSGDLGCCRDKRSPLLMFTISATLIGSLPILFYGAAFFFTKAHQSDSDNFPVSNVEHQPNNNQPLTINSDSTQSTVQLVVNRKSNDLRNQLPGASSGSGSHTVPLANQPKGNKKKQNNIDAARQKKLNQKSQSNKNTTSLDTNASTTNLQVPSANAALMRFDDHNLQNVFDSNNSTKKVQHLNVTEPTEEDDLPLCMNTMNE